MTDHQQIETEIVEQLRDARARYDDLTKEIKQAESDREQAIRQALAHGCSVRVIAEHAGISHTAVRNIHRRNLAAPSRRTNRGVKGETLYSRGTLVVTQDWKKRTALVEANCDDHKSHPHLNLTEIKCKECHRPLKEYPFSLWKLSGLGGAKKGSTISREQYDAIRPVFGP